MLRQSAAPIRNDLVSGLQQSASTRRLPAAHQPGMTAMLARQQLGDQRAFAMPPNRQYKPGVTPLHLRIVIESERGVALGVLDPVFPHLDEQEEVDAAVEHLLQLGARLGADRLYATPGLAGHDRGVGGSMCVNHQNHDGSSAMT